MFYDRQVVVVKVDGIIAPDERTKALEAADNGDWLAEYKLVGTTPFAAEDQRIAAHFSSSRRTARAGASPQRVLVRWPTPGAAPRSDRGAPRATPGTHRT